jgi:predicted phosphohydrolase
MKEVNNQVVKVANEAGALSLEKVLIQGDLSSLTSSERVKYLQLVCTSLGLNPLTKPFDYIVLNGKLTLYAKRDCTEQLRKIHEVSIAITSREVVQDCYIVTAKATDKTGRSDESIGAVDIAGLKGEKLSNAMMKAETKAKRRVTLSICGMGMLDETEVSSVLSTPSMTDDSSPAQQLHALCKEAEIDSIEFGKFHNINKKNPETIINGVNNFSLLKQQYIDYAAANSDTQF